MTKSMFEQEVEVPYLLKDVADPCTERYYPQWSSRAMRSVRCTRPAKATFDDHNKGKRRVCGIHAKRLGRVWPERIVRDA